MRGKDLHAVDYILLVLSLVLSLGLGIFQVSNSILVKYSGSNLASTVS